VQASDVKVCLRIVLAFCLSLSAFGEAKTQWRLILSEETAQPGQTVWAGLEMKIPPKWHTYWRNPGDSGIPTSIKWTLPNGIKAGDIQWPVPTKFTESQGEVSLTTYIYHDTVVLLIPLEIAKDAPPGPIDLRGKVAWQECEQLCVQGHTDVSATLTVGTTTKPSADAALIEQWRKKVPQPSANTDVKARWESAGTAEERPLVIDVVSKESSQVDFIPYKQNGVEIGGTTQRTVDGGTAHLRKVVTKSEGEWPTHVTGLVVTGNDAVEVDVQIGSTPAVAASASG
jgi:thiol:disulfide interchange protein DsbD